MATDVQVKSIGPLDNGVDPATSADSAGDVMDRREVIDLLLKLGAGSLVAAIASGATLGPLADIAQGAQTGAKYRYGMVIDTRRCVGCRACVAACKAENKTPPDVSYIVVLEEATGEEPDDRPLFLAKPCFQCEKPPCVPVCPVGATFKREQDGIVVVDYDRCIGCRYCIVACPYQARFFDFGANYPAVDQSTPYSTVPSPEYQEFRVREDGSSPIGNVRKCTFCLHLQDEEGKYDKADGRWPACAKTCTGRAIHFGDFNDPESEVSQLLKSRHGIRLKEELGTQPNVYYLV